MDSYLSINNSYYPKFIFQIVVKFYKKNYCIFIIEKELE